MGDDWSTGTGTVRERDDRAPSPLLDHLCDCRSPARRERNGVRGHQHLRRRRRDERVAGRRAARRADHTRARRTSSLRRMLSRSRWRWPGAPAPGSRTGWARRPAETAWLRLLRDLPDVQVSPVPVLGSTTSHSAGCVGDLGHGTPLSADMRLGLGRPARAVLIPAEPIGPGFPTGAASRGTQIYV